MSRATVDEDDDFSDLAEFDEPEAEDDFADLIDDDEEIEPIEETVEIPITRLGSTGAVKSRGEEVVTLGRDRVQSRKPASFITIPATKLSEAIRQGHISGHCSAPQSKHPEQSHARCAGYNRANPDKVFSPCPCRCHFPKDEYECGNCGATIVAAPHWPADEDGDTRYLHLDPKTSRVLVSEECPR